MMWCTMCAVCITRCQLDFQDAMLQLSCLAPFKQKQAAANACLWRNQPCSSAERKQKRTKIPRLAIVQRPTTSNHTNPSNPTQHAPAAEMPTPNALQICTSFPEGKQRAGALPWNKLRNLGKATLERLVQMRAATNDSCHFLPKVWSDWSVPHASSETA